MSKMHHMSKSAYMVGDERFGENNAAQKTDMRLRMTTSSFSSEDCLGGEEDLREVFLLTFSFLSRLVPRPSISINFYAGHCGE